MGWEIYTQQVRTGMLGNFPFLSFLLFIEITASEAQANEWERLRKKKVCVGFVFFNSLFTVEFYAMVYR